jgi:hypothetical protein
MALSFLEGLEKPRLKPLPEHFSVTGHPRAPPRVPRRRLLCYHGAREHRPSLKFMLLPRKREAAPGAIAD